jgi:solute carrier family 38 (sodium-coupled neutral amino acid transporter), member 11
MVVIVITIIVQGVRVSSDLRGDIKGFLFINSGIFQAIGVISFGKDHSVFCMDPANNF